MAYAINKKSFSPPEMAMSFPHRQTAADVTATTTVTAGAFGDLANIGCPGRLAFIKAHVKIKALVGTCTIALEVADNTGFSTNRRQIDAFTAITAAILGTCTLQGWSDEITAQYYRLFLTFGTSGTVDIEVFAMPIS